MFSQNKCKTRANANKVAAFQNFPYFHQIFFAKTDILSDFSRKWKCFEDFSENDIFANSKICKNGKRHFDFNPTTGSADTT